MSGHSCTTSTSHLHQATKTNDFLHSFAAYLSDDADDLELTSARPLRLCHASGKGTCTSKQTRHDEMMAQVLGTSIRAREVEKSTESLMSVMVYLKRDVRTVP